MSDLDEVKKIVTEYPGIYCRKPNIIVNPIALRTGKTLHIYRVLAVLSAIGLNDASHWLP